MERRSIAIIGKSDRLDNSLHISFESGHKPQDNEFEAMIIHKIFNGKSKVILPASAHHIEIAIDTMNVKEAISL